MGVTMPLAINQRGFSIDVAREGAQKSKDKEKDHILHNIVDEYFFDTMAVPILRGRGFQASDDADARPVAVINESLATTYWPADDPIGKRIRIRLWSGEVKWVEVVGVARMGKYVWMTEAPTDYLYLPLAQNYRGTRVLFAEANGDSASLAAPIREVVRGLDANMPVYDVRTMEEYFSGWVVGSANTTVFIVGIMGLTGLVLAMIGLYGLVAYSVTRRTREFGIRMAIGANKASVLRMVLKQGAMLCLAGIVIGTALSFPASRALASVVFTAGTDPVPYVVVPVLLIFVTLLATYGPARRASTIDPMKALREA